MRTGRAAKVSQTLKPYMYLRRGCIGDGQPEDETVTPELGPVALRLKLHPGPQDQGKE